MIFLLNAEPVMLNVDHDTPMVTPALEEAIAPRTCVIVPVYYQAHTYALGKCYGIPVIEDVAAHAAAIAYKSRHVGAAGALAQYIRSLKFSWPAVDKFDRTMQDLAPHRRGICLLSA